MLGFLLNSCYRGCIHLQLPQTAVVAHSSGSCNVSVTWTSQRQVQGASAPVPTSVPPRAEMLSLKVSSRGRRNTDMWIE